MTTNLQSASGPTREPAVCMRRRAAKHAYSKQCPRNNRRNSSAKEARRKQQESAKNQGTLAEEKKKETINKWKQRNRLKKRWGSRNQITDIKKADQDNRKNPEKCQRGTTK